MYIVVKFKYFDEIYKGVKGVEFRADTERWQKILTGKTHIVFVRGHLYGFRQLLQFFFVSDDFLHVDVVVFFCFIVPCFAPVTVCVSLKNLTWHHLRHDCYEDN